MLLLNMAFFIKGSREYMFLYLMSGDATNFIYVFALQE